MTYSQKYNHFSHRFLQSLGLVVEELIIGDFVRCRSVDDAGRSRGEYTYRATRNPMARPGLVGLSTWARAPGGKTETHKTYGNDMGFDENPIKCPAKILPPKEKEIVYSEDITRRCREIWDSASLTGVSPYLETKKVASYGRAFWTTNMGSRQSFQPVTIWEYCVTFNFLTQTVKSGLCQDQLSLVCFIRLVSL